MGFRERCRPKYSEAELEEIYRYPWHMDETWKDHRQRRAKTLLLMGRFIDEMDHRGADLSCGDAYFASFTPQIEWVLGDYGPGFAIQGPIEETIEQIDPVDVFLCCETLEHLDDPDSVLKQIRRKSKKLILSTPICQWWDENPEHYWAWDQGGIRRMLFDAGWQYVDYEETYSDPGYCFQIWGCV